MTRPRTYSRLTFLCLLLTAIFLTNVAAQRQRPKQSVPVAAPTPVPLRLEYTLAFPQPHTHLYEVSFTVGNVAAPTLDFVMPTWTPGSYLQREFARHVRDFTARNAEGHALPWRKTDKSTWQVETNGGSIVYVSYRVYAYELSVRTSHLDASHAYFNGTNIFMYLRGSKDVPHRLKINAPDGWQVTSPLALAPDAQGFFTAPNYDILADSPTEVGTHKLLEFDVRGKRHRIAVWGEAGFDERQLQNDFSKIVEECARIFGGLPYEHYTFIVHLQAKAGGGLEHLNSTTMQASPDFYRTRKRYVGFLSLTAHEYFHLWNVKRIRPLALGPFEYDRENYTRALWLSEGVTDYYGDLLLRRAGLTSVNEYLEDLADTMFSYESAPGRLQQSPETASFDSWIRHYRPDENSPNVSMSYYTSGKLLGFLLDLEIRSRTSNARSLDDVLRYLYENYALKGTGFPENELKGAFEKVAGSDLSDLFARYVSGAENPDFNRWFQLAGLQLDKRWKPSPYHSDDSKPGWIGVRVPGGEVREEDSADAQVIIRTVYEGSPAYVAGVSALDEIVAINGWKTDGRNIQTRLAMLRAGEPVMLTLFRRDKLLTLTMTAAPKPPDLYRVALLKNLNDAQRALLTAWLKAELKV